MLLDAAFSLMSTVLTPFPQNSTSAFHKQFNTIFSETRGKVEHAFGALVSRWRTLWKHLYMLDEECMARTILACCVLHNICIDANDVEEEESTPMHSDTEAVYEQFKANDDRDGLGGDAVIVSLPADRSECFSVLSSQEARRQQNQLRADGRALRQALLEQLIPRAR